MRLSLSFLGLLSLTFTFAQITDTIKSKEIEAVNIIAKKPTKKQKSSNVGFVNMEGLYPNRLLKDINHILKVLSDI